MEPHPDIFFVHSINNTDDGLTHLVLVLEVDLALNIGDLALIGEETLQA